MTEPDEPEPVENQKVLGPHNLVAVGTAIAIATALFSAYLWVKGLGDRAGDRIDCLQRRVEYLEREAWRVEDHRRFATYLRKHAPQLSDSIPWTDDVLNQRKGEQK